MWRCPVSRSAGLLPLNGCVTPCRLGNLPGCQNNTPSLQRRKTFTILQVVTRLPNYTQSLFYQTTRSHSSTTLHAATLYPTTRSHSSTKLHAVTLLPNYAQSLFYQTTRRHSSTKLHAVTHAECSTMPCPTPPDSIL